MPEALGDDDTSYEWLTESLFEPIIEKELAMNKNDFTIKFLSTKPAVGKGDNYVSLVMRVQLEVSFQNDVDMRPKIYHFVTKSNIKFMQDIEDLEIFEKEMVFYDEIAPKLLKYDETIRFIPKCYLTTLVPKKIIVLDDLVANGFKMQNRMVGLDLEHCKIFFKSLAQYHALTASYYVEYGNFGKIFHESHFRMEVRNNYDKWMNKIYPEFLNIFTRYDNLKPYYEKFKKWDSHIFDIINESTKTNPDEFNVLNHGDGWINNILFSYDTDQKPVDACFVDFQLSVFGSPVTDLFYFFVSSPAIEVREHHFDELLEAYHFHLTDHLKRYNYSKPIPTIQQLHEEFFKKRVLGAYFLTGVAAFVLLDSEDSEPSYIFLEDDERGRKFRYKLFNNPRYIRMMEVMLKFFESRGFLDH